MDTAPNAKSDAALAKAARVFAFVAAFPINVLLLMVPLFVREMVFLALDFRFVALALIASLWIFVDEFARSARIESPQTVRHHDRAFDWFAYFAAPLVLVHFWILVAFLVPASNREGLTWSMGSSAPGLGLALCGLALRYSAIASLDEFFFTELKVLSNQPLVEKGPFFWLRHPSYAGLLLIVTGAFLQNPCLPGLLFLLLVIVPVVLYRILREERAMRAGFGAAYLEYCSRTHRLIPGVF